MSRPSGLTGGMWFLPVMCVLAGIVLSATTVWIDRIWDFELVPRWLTGGPDAALGILGTIATSMVSLAALVLTITMVVVQLAMGQFSPRIVQNFLQDRPSQLTIGLFVATFAHAMVAMREVQFEGDGQVPGLAIAVAYVLVLTSIAMLVFYVHHIGQSLRVSALIELVGSDTRKQLDRWYPDSIGEEVDDPNVIPAAESGVLLRIDHEALVQLASDADCMLRLTIGVGAFVPAGAPLLAIEGDPHAVESKAVLDAMSFGLERRLDGDVAYGFRMLVDMGERAISESAFLDPTTAVQTIDRLHDGLRQLAGRRFPDGVHRDASGTQRLLVPTMAWDDFVHLAFDEIRLAGHASPQVSRRLFAAFDDLLEVAPPERRPSLQEQRDLLTAAVDRLELDRPDLESARTPDRHGFGTSGNGIDDGAAPSH